MWEPEQNERGEINGCGPAWACSDFGRSGHNYMTCPDCNGKFAERFGKN